jgi:hypothetical protein
MVGFGVGRFRGRTGVARTPKTKEAAHRTASLILIFGIRRFKPARRGVLTPVGRQNRNRSPAVGAKLLKTWKPFASPPDMAEYMKPA